MEPGSPVIACGLERDYRRDEFSTRYLGQQDEFPTPCRPTNPSVLSNNHLDQPPIPQTSPTPWPIANRICGFRKSKFWLGFLGFVLFVVIVVGGGVFGSLLAKKKIPDSEKSLNLTSSPFTTIPPSLSSPTPPLENLRTLSSSSLTSISSLSSPMSPQETLPTLSSSTSTTSPGSSAQTRGVQKILPQPSNDCEAIEPQYTAQLREDKFLRSGITNTVFDIYCQTDFNVGAFMSFYSPSITTCIDGCAAYNAWQIYHNYPRGLNCSGVTYGIKQRGYGNCFLKAAGIVAATFESTNFAYAKLKT